MVTIHDREKILCGVCDFFFCFNKLSFTIYNNYYILYFDILIIIILNLLSNPRQIFTSKRRRCYISQRHGQKKQNSITQHTILQERLTATVIITSSRKQLHTSHVFIFTKLFIVTHYYHFPCPDRYRMYFWAGVSRRLVSDWRWWCWCWCYARLYYCEYKYWCWSEDITIRHQIGGQVSLPDS